MEEVKLSIRVKVKKERICREEDDIRKVEDDN